MALQVPVDAYDPEQGQLEGFQDTEPHDDFFPQGTHGGQLLYASVDNPLLAGRATKCTHSGTIYQFSLVKMEYCSFPNAAKVIQKGDLIPWEAHVSSNILFCENWMMYHLCSTQINRNRICGLNILSVIVQIGALQMSPFSQIYGCSP